MVLWRWLKSDNPFWIFSAVSVFSEDLPISWRSIRIYIGLNILYSIRDILVMSNFSV